MVEKLKRAEPSATLWYSWWYNYLRKKKDGESKEKLAKFSERRGRV